jgi:hypothetical protein
MTKVTKKYFDIGFWESKYGWTTKITPDVIERLERLLKTAKERGAGLLSFSELKEEWKTETGPTFRLNYVAPKGEAETANSSESL